MRVYVASSWRNKRQPSVVEALREAGHEVYDFRHPAPENSGFAWSDIDPDWLCWNAQQFRDALDHPIAKRGFAFDMDALDACEACVLVLPCGRSAHLELGYAVGRNKHTFVLLTGRDEPGLMYRMVDGVCSDIDEVIDALADAARADADDKYDGYEPDDDGRCWRCGGEGSVEYNDAPEVWGEDSPSEENHLVECPECHGEG